jgi:hypothetical protein
MSSDEFEFRLAKAEAITEDAERLAAIITEAVAQRRADLARAREALDVER